MCKLKLIVFILSFIIFNALSVKAEPGKVDDDLGSSREGSRTNDDSVEKEAEAIKLDGLSVKEMQHLMDRAKKQSFQAEVSRLMKLIINSLYTNKEIFLRELVSNGSDALDKIRVRSLTEKEQMDSNPELTIRIKADKENHVLHITDTGIGMTEKDLISNLGTIAKSGTSEFFEKFKEGSTDEQSDLIGQFGVGFYSSFLVADTVVVTSKHNDDDQHIWESDVSSFSVIKDPRGNTLGRGTTISLHLKEEAYDFIELDTIKRLLTKYSQFINFPIYLWESKTETVEEPIEETEEKKEEQEKTEEDKVDDDESSVEEDKEAEKPKTKKVEKTTWDWVLINNVKPIWTRKPSEITDEEYNEFYKVLSKESEEPLCKTHFVAEGEVTFRSLLFVPKTQSSSNFNTYGSSGDNIKLYVRRIFITDNFKDMLPNYLSFVRGLVDSDDLPLNVSRESLQQHKLLKVIKKKLVRKVLDMLKKLEKEEYDKFWAEYSTNIKLGIVEDSANRNRLSKLLKFQSSTGEVTSLAEYVERMKDKQDHIFYMAGQSQKEVETSPFVERLLKKGYEVLYLVEAIDEYAINALPEFDGKKFQNVAKEGLTLDDSAAAKEIKEQYQANFAPLTKWLSENALKDLIARTEVSERLSDSPCALVSSRFGWTANMERIVSSQTHAKSKDSQRDHQMNQRKNLEINPRHPLVKELLRRVESDAEDATAKKIAMMMYRTAVLRSGYSLEDTADFAKSVEDLMRQTLGVSLDEQVEEEVEIDESQEPEKSEDVEAEEEQEEKDEMKDEL